MQIRTRKLVLPVLLLACLGNFSAGARAQQPNKPLNPQEVRDLVQNYVPSERIVELIRQFGISFEPTDQYLKDLRKAGADDELIGALRAVQPRAPTTTPAQAAARKQAQQNREKQPLSFNQVSNLLVNNIPNDAIIQMVDEYGITFEPDKDYLKSLRGSGADANLISALRKAKRFVPPAAPEPKPEETAKTSEPEEGPPKTPEVKTARVTPPAGPASQPAAGMPEAPAHTEPYNVGGEVSPPTALYTPNAPYTEQARRAHLQGTVVLGIVINEHGKVTNIEELSKPLGMGLDESAIQAVGSWVFRAAQFRGEPVPVRVNVKVEFHQQF
jgi:TonB family protein